MKDHTRDCSFFSPSRGVSLYLHGSDGVRSANGRIKKKYVHELESSRRRSPICIRANKKVQQNDQARKSLSRMLVLCIRLAHLKL